jgi:hypothetical protein
MPAVTDICEAVVAAINAASLAGDLPFPLTAVDEYSLTLAMENASPLSISIQPGLCQRETGTLDGGVSEASSARMIFQASPVLSETSVIKTYLDLVELVCDKVEAGIGADFIFLGADHEGDQLYDQNRLRSDAVFYSVLTANFSSLRYGP